MIVLYGDSLSAEASPYFADELARTTRALVDGREQVARVAREALND